MSISRRLTSRLIIFVLSGGSFLYAQTSARVRLPVSNSNRAQLANSIRPELKEAADLGLVDRNQPLMGVTIFLSRTREQVAELDKLLLDQMDRTSTRYQQWLTSEEFGERFGANPQDISKVRDWLLDSGFTNVKTAKGGDFITADGTVAAAGLAFGTDIHGFVMTTGDRVFANSSPVSIPQALTPLIGSIFGLDNMTPKHIRSRQTSEAIPHFNDVLNTHFLSAEDLRTIYNVSSLYGSKISGSGITIVIVGEYALMQGDTSLATYRILNGLPPLNLQIVSPNQTSDTGSDASDVETEAFLDIEIAGAIAQDATIVYEYDANFFNAMTDAIDQNRGQILSISFGGCEEILSQTANFPYLESELKRANVQGITVVVASGDTGAAGCDLKTATTASQGLAVEYPASSVYVTAIGGTRFNENENDGSYSGPYWGTQDLIGGSAVHYIPEDAWNDVSSTSGIGGASGGGISHAFSAPSWQAAIGKRRSVPDLSFAASSLHDGYVLCTPSISCVGGFHPLVDGAVGGTSAAAPLFAGIVALIDQKLSPLSPRQGNITARLYALAQSPLYNFVFHDVTQGSNQIPALGGGYIGYPAGSGFDLATGWGSVDAYALASAMNGVPVISSWTVSPLSLSFGGLVTISYSAGDSSGSGLTRAELWRAPDVNGQPGIWTQITSQQLSGGGAFPVSFVDTPPGTGKYWYGTHLFDTAGDEALEPQPVQVTVNTISSPKASTSTGVTTSSTLIPQGATVALTALVQSTSGTPTGSVAVLDNGNTLGSVVLDRSGAATYNTTALTFGTNSISAKYGGDPNFSGSTSSATNVTVTGIAPVVAVTPSSGIIGVTSFTKTDTGFTPYGLITHTVTLPDNTKSVLTSYANAVGGYQYSVTYSLQKGIYTQVDIDGTTGKATAPISWLISTAVQNDFSLQVSPSSQSVTQGGSAAYTIASTTTSGAGQSIAFTAGNLPPGVTASFNPATVQSGGSTTLTLTTSATTTPGNYQITVIGNGANANHASSISLSVTATVTGAKLQSSPASFTFTSPQTVNTLSAPFVFSLVNSGGSPLTISSLTASPQFVPSFLNGLGLPITLQPNGGYANMQVVFIPNAAGVQNGTIQLFNNTNAGPLTISLSGTGVAAPVTTGNIQVDATFNGSPWTGPVYFGVAGLMSYSGSTVPVTYFNSAPGSYTVNYTGAGPGGATFTGITPSATQLLVAGGNSTFTLNFTGVNQFAFGAPQPTSVAIAAGSSTQFQLDLCIVSGATQTVQLAVAGLPTAATATFTSNPATVGCNSSASIATIATSSTTPPGVYSLVFTGINQDGLSISSSPATLTVNLPPVSPMQLVSVSTGGVEGNGYSGAVFSNSNLASNATSADGRYVAFDSSATNLVPSDTNSQPDIFLRDLQAGTTSRISVSSNGAQADFDSLAPSISADGRFIAYKSEAGNLTSTSTNGQYGMYVRDTNSGQTTRVDLAPNGSPANGVATSVSISADGRFVAFASLATNLAVLAPNGGVFVRDTMTGKLLIASISYDGTTTSSGGQSAISADGRFVAFTSAASNLILNDTNGRTDLFVHDFLTGTTTRVNVATNGTQDDCGIGSSNSVAISADGRFVSFQSCGTMLAPASANPNGYSSAYIHDMVTGTTSPLAVTAQGVILSAGSVGTISADGRFAVYNANVVDRSTGFSTSLNVAADGSPGNGSSGVATVSTDGSIITFSSGSSNLVNGDTNQASDVFSVANPFVASTHVTSLAINQVAAAGGSTISGSVVLSAPAPLGGATVVISSNNNAAQVPATLYIPAGAMSAPISFNTSIVTTETVVTLIASYNGGSPIALLTLEPSGQLAVNPPNWDFGYEAVGTMSGAQTFTVTNSGTAVLSLNSMQLSTGQSFTIGATTCGSSIAPGAGCSVPVTFKPLVAGAVSDALQIGYGNPAAFQTISLAGYGATPLATLSPTTLSFSSPGTPSATAVLTNSGNAPLSNIAATISGVNVADYSISSDGCSGLTLPANSSCLLTIAFAPAASGIRIASLSVSDSDSGSPQTVALTGSQAQAAQPSPWTHTWGGSATESGNAVTTDSAGGVYIAGTTQSSGAGGQDVLLVKYDPAGSVLWTKTWGGTNNDFASSVLVDPSGNAYVVGGTNSFGAGSYDVLILKFDAFGNILWARTWGGGGYDVGYDVAFDQSGNIEIAAESYSYGDAAVFLKFTSAGTFVGSSTWKGRATYDSAYSITVDTNGNTILTGTSWDYSISPNHNSILVLKYDNQGNLLWNRNWAGPNEDEVTGRRTVLTDANGNIYIAGHTSTTCNNTNFSLCDFDVLLLKIDPSGNLIWARKWGGTGLEIGNALSLDSNQNIGVVGSTTSFNSGLQGALLQQYDSSGNVLSSKVMAASIASGLNGISLTSAGTYSITGTAPNVSGTWTDTGLSSAIATGTLTNPAGHVASPTGTTGTPSGITGSPTGTIDTGGGGADALTAVGTFPPAVSGTLLTPALTVTPSASTIPIVQPLTVTIAVRGGSGNPIPTGSVTMTSGNYTSGALTLSGGQVSISVAAGSLATGTNTLTAIYTPDSSSSATYTGATASSSITITPQSTPSISWTTPAAITYGTTLGAAQLNASASVPGSFAYTPSQGTVLTAGSHTLSVTFTPTDAVDYTSATATVSIAVSQAIPTTSWPTPAQITYGTALGIGQLNATASVPGTFTYVPTAGTTLPAGMYTLGTTFIPTDAVDYSSTTTTVSLVVRQATPTIAWSTPAQIAYGTPLSASQLNASASVPGTLLYSPPIGSVLTAGSHTLTATFTPADLVDYSAATASVSITVTPSASVLTWPTPATIVYGTALGSGQLNASSSVPGTFNYAPSAGAVLSAGPHAISATFTPTDLADYTVASLSNTVAVSPAPMTVTANNASRIFGAQNPPLSGAVSGAVNGDTFNVSATTSAATTSNVGNYAILPTVSGTNINDYAVTAVNGTLTITQASSQVVLSSSNANSNLTSPVTFTATVSSGSSGTVTGTVTFMDGPVSLGSATLNAQGAASLTTSSLAVGVHSIAAIYGGSLNYSGSTSSGISQTVIAPDYSLVVNPTSLTLKQGTSGTAVFTITPVGGFSQTIQLNCSGLPINASCAFNPLTVTPNGGPTMATLTITTHLATGSRGRPIGSPMLATTLSMGQFGFCGGVLVGLVTRRKRLYGHVRRSLMTLISLAVALVLSISVAGCGAHTFFDSPVGNSQVIVTASTGGGTTSHTAALTLQVTP